VFRFGNPEFLYLFFLLPLLTLLFVFWRINRAKKLKKLGDAELVNRLIIDGSNYKPFVKFTFSILIISSLILALANPQMGSKLEKVKRSGIEIMFALDVSNSMLAQDIQPSRLDRATQLLNKFVDELVSDKVGLVVFAGDAFLQMPLSTDYSAAKLMISTSATDLIGTQGTAIGKAIDICRASFSQDKKVKKVIVVISDGENHEDDAIGSARESEASGIRVYTIGMGTPDGAPIPLGRNSNQYLKSSSGEVVVTKMSPEMLSQIADAGDGEYAYGGAKFSDIQKVIKEISTIEKKDFEDMVYTDYDDKFSIFLWIALVLIIIDFFVLEKRSPILSKFNLFGVSK
jgi:Ca-activated chloride channel family protein